MAFPKYFEQGHTVHISADNADKEPWRLQSLFVLFSKLDKGLRGRICRMHDQDGALSVAAVEIAEDEFNQIHSLWKSLGNGAVAVFREEDEKELFSTDKYKPNARAQGVVAP